MKNSGAKKKQRRSSVSDIRLSGRSGGGRSSSSTGADTAPPRQQRRSSVSDIRLSGRSGGGSRSPPSTGAGAAPPRQQRQHLEIVPRQQRRRSVGTLRNRKIRRSSLATVDLLNSLMFDSSVSRDLVVGEGGGFATATSTRHSMDVGSGGRDGEGGGQLNLGDGEASGGGGEGNLEHLYGVLNDVGSSQEESDEQRMERPQSGNAGNGGRRLKRSSSLTTLGDLRRRSSLGGPSDLFRESMLNDSFVLKLHGSETSLQATDEENVRAQATGPTEGGADADRSSSRRSSLEVGRRSKSCGDQMVSLVVETQPLRKGKSRGSPPPSSVDMNQHSFSTLTVLGNLFHTSTSSDLYVNKTSDDKYHKSRKEKEEQEDSGCGIATPLVHLFRGKMSRLLCSFATLALIVAAGCMFKHPHHPFQASYGILSSGWERALGILGSQHLSSTVTGEALGDKLLSDTSTGNRDNGGRGLGSLPVKGRQSRWKKRRKRKRGRPKWKRQKKRNKVSPLPDATPQSIGKQPVTRLFTPNYFQWTKGRGRRRRRPCTTSRDETSDNVDSSKGGNDSGGESRVDGSKGGSDSDAVRRNIFGRDTSGGGKGKGRHLVQTGSESDDFVLKESKSSRGGKVCTMGGWLCVYVCIVAISGF